MNIIVALIAALRRLLIGEPTKSIYRGAPIFAGTAALTFQPHIAAALGTHEAIILQKFHEWLEYNRFANKRDHFRDGRWWTYNTYADWQEEHFWFLSASSLKRICLKLEKLGVLLSSDKFSSPLDRTKWYSIDYQKLSALVSVERPKRVPSASQKNPLVGSKQSADSNRETARNAFKPQKSNHQQQPRAHDDDVDLLPDSGEELLTKEGADNTPILEETRHEASAEALSPSSAAPLPRSVRRLVDEKELNPQVALEYLARLPYDECEYAAGVALASKRAINPAGLWRTFMDTRAYRDMSPVTQQTADDYSGNYADGWGDQAMPLFRSAKT